MNGFEKLTPHIRWMIRRDMPEVIDIEFLSFDYPWSESDFICCLQKRDNIGMTAEHADKIVGFMVYTLCKENLTILNFAVHDEYRRRGVGRRMIEKLKSKLSGKRHSLVWRVWERNVCGQKFLAACGFRCVGIDHGFYDYYGSDVDAYRFEFDIRKASKTK